MSTRSAPTAPPLGIAHARRVRRMSNLLALQASELLDISESAVAIPFVDLGDVVNTAASEGVAASATGEQAADDGRVEVPIPRGLMDAIEAGHAIPMATPVERSKPPGECVAGAFFARVPWSGRAPAEVIAITPPPKRTHAGRWFAGLPWNGDVVAAPPRDTSAPGTDWGTDSFSRAGDWFAAIPWSGGAA